MMPSQASPYSGLGPEAFWRTGVAEANLSAPEQLYRKKFDIASSDRIATAGSCFAQHIGRNLRSRQFSVIDAEPAPAGLARAEHNRFGYSIYSARYGNVYSVRQMLQLAKEAFGETGSSEIAWRGKNGRYFDALRPGVEPDGLFSIEEVIAHRRYHLKKVAEVLSTMDIFIFTMGLTETWVDRRTGTVLPTAPGTIAGEFDDNLYQFHNLNLLEIYQDFIEVMQVLERQRGPGRPLRYIITVSPVPLTATASGKHVLAATIYSKSVLRAVAGQLANEFPSIDYFPSFEIVCNPWGAQRFYEANMREVRPEGVAAVMRVFFSEHLPSEQAPVRLRAGTRAKLRVTVAAPQGGKPGKSEGDVICEEELLNAFATRASA
jgi:hypothetical protein